MKDKKVRLQVALSKAGVTSRRKAADIIKEGRVLVNGEVIRERGYRVDPADDNIIADGRKIGKTEKKTYIIINKPPNFITSKSDPQGRKTVISLLPHKYRYLHPVGRLDRDTSGLLIMTDDGDLTYRLTHPKFEIQKTYRVICKGEVGAKGMERLKRGMVIDGRKTARASVKVIKADRTKSELLIKIHEGRKRQIRKMFLYLGHPIKKLERLGYEKLSVGGLAPGEFRHLTDKEVETLKDL